MLPPSSSATIANTSYPLFGRRGLNADVPCCTNQSTAQCQCAPHSHCRRRSGTLVRISRCAVSAPQRHCPRHALLPTTLSKGRGRFLQLLSASLSTCRRFHRAEGNRGVGQVATSSAAFTRFLWARPPKFEIFEATSPFTCVAAW